LKDPQGRLARWQLRLQQFDFELVHRRGKENIVPDFLSRSVPVATDCVRAGEQNSVSTIKDEWYLDMLERVKQHPVKFPVWRVENDTLYKYVKSTIPDLSFYRDDWKIVVPKDRRKDILHRCHDKPTSGHVGVFKTFGKLLQHYYWPKMRKDVASW